MESVLSQGRVRRVRHELRRRSLEVRRVESRGPGFVAVTLGGAEIEGFVSLSFDDHLKLFVPAPDGTLVRRDYTPRHHDAAQGELTIELALHGDGPACDWARRVQRGQTVDIAGPRGSMILPDDLPWHLLAGDATALPAIARRLEEPPAGAEVTAIVRVNDLGDARTIASDANVRLKWLDADEPWLAALAEWTPPPGEGFAWAAGEAGLMRRARELLRSRHALPGHSMRVSAYWKRGEAEFHESLDDGGATG